jgi:hypothetical protein
MPATSGCQTARKTFERSREKSGRARWKTKGERRGGMRKEEGEGPAHVVGMAEYFEPGCFLYAISSIAPP